MKVHKTMRISEETVLTLKALGKDESLADGLEKLAVFFKDYSEEREIVMKLLEQVCWRIDDGVLRDEIKGVLSDEN